jgi:hypothetical protein
VRLAKMDVLNQLKPVNPGTYYLVPLVPNLAKMDALAQRITIIPVGYKPSGSVLQRRTRWTEPAPWDKV